MAAAAYPGRPAGGRGSSRGRRRAREGGACACGTQSQAQSGLCSGHWKPRCRQTGVRQRAAAGCRATTSHQRLTVVLHKRRAMQRQAEGKSSLVSHGRRKRRAGGEKNANVPHKAEGKREGRKTRAFYVINAPCQPPTPRPRRTSAACPLCAHRPPDIPSPW
jgi:hypothetical protein